MELHTLNRLNSEFYSAFQFRVLQSARPYFSEGAYSLKDAATSTFPVTTWDGLVFAVFPGLCYNPGSASFKVPVLCFWRVLCFDGCSNIRFPSNQMGQTSLRCISWTASQFKVCILWSARASSLTTHPHPSFLVTKWDYQIVLPFAVFTVNICIFNIWILFIF